MGHLELRKYWFSNRLYDGEESSTAKTSRSLIIIWVVEFWMLMTLHVVQFLFKQIYIHFRLFFFFSNVLIYRYTKNICRLNFLLYLRINVHICTHIYIDVYVYLFTIIIIIYKELNFLHKFIILIFIHISLIFFSSING